MALSENIKTLHAAQNAFAEEYFKNYKEQVARAFIDKFGGSYQRHEEIGDTWRKFYKYDSKCEKFLKETTITFLGTLPENGGNTRSPRLLNNLIAKISEYLSAYISKKYENPDKERNNCTRALIEFFKNHPALKQMMEKFQRKKEREWGLLQKERRERKAAKQQEKQDTQHKKRQRIGEQSIVYQSERTNKQKDKNIRARIRLKRNEITQLEIFIRTVRQK
jgi:hypothetical protein